MATSNLCVRGCGFFGNPVNDNMCSSCFKKYGKESTPVVMAPPLDPESKLGEEKVETRPVQENKSRCFKCKRKVGLTGIEVVHIYLCSSILLCTNR